MFQKIEIKEKTCYEKIRFWRLLKKSITDYIASAMFVPSVLIVLGVVFIVFCAMFFFRWEIIVAPSHPVIVRHNRLTGYCGVSWSSGQVEKPVVRLEDLPIVENEK